jgi:hypothetical protein
MCNESPTIEENPYQSPLTDSQDASSRLECKYPTATRAVLAGAWKGAKFGAKWMGLILGSIVFVICVFFSVEIVYRIYRQGYDYQYVLEGLKLFGSCILGVLLITFYTAIISAIIMGVSEGVSYWRSNKKPKS